MSLLFVSYDKSKSDGKQLTQVELDSVAVNTIYNKVISPIVQYVDDADFLDEAEANLFLESVSFTSLERDNFNRAYKLLIDAIDSETSLKPYKAELINAMQADPRYKVPNPA